MSEAAMDRLFEESTSLVEFLNQSGKFRVFADEHLSKILLLAAASHFEKRMTDAVMRWSKQRLSVDHPLVNLIKNKAVSRQYHQWFVWEGHNANKFFSLFGKRFLEYAKQSVKGDEELHRSIRSFLQLGNERNRLVHGDYVTFTIEKSRDDVYLLYKDASKFVNWFQQAVDRDLEVPEQTGESPADDRADVPT